MDEKPYLAKGTCVRVAVWGMRYAPVKFGTVDHCFRADEWRIVVAFPDGTHDTFASEDVTVVTALDMMADL